MSKITKTILDELHKKSVKKIQPQKPMITVGLGTCGIGNGADKLYAGFEAFIKEKKLDIKLSAAGCFGFCAEEPFVGIYLPGKPFVFWSKVKAEDISEITESLSKSQMPLRKAIGKISKWDFLTSKIDYGNDFAAVKEWNELDFFKGQKKIVLRNAGLINPDDIEEYIAVGGYQALSKVLTEANPEAALNEIKKSGLRGRGGAGYPTVKKWEIMRAAAADQKYIICNADEGDPGAYMNRNEIESDPHNLIEGMIIGAYLMGASKGIVYMRAEYPLAVKRLRTAIEQARDIGLLGENIFGSKFSYDMMVVEGAGAFVCGEETALIASIEGKAGRPMPRPPYPGQKGLWGKPTNINNVETWFNIPVILLNGGDKFAETGTKTSTGTKVFSLVGKIKNTGLVELPLGTLLEDLVYGMGGGSGGKKKIRSVQTGGPSGGCIPVQHFNTPIDYESLNALGAIMGSGGMVVMDHDNCMVDVARYFVEFTSQESCGKCTPCREGLSQSLDILNKITAGQAEKEDLETLETLAPVIRDTSLCGLGQTSANPVLTTIHYFRDEYEKHIEERRCTSGVCEHLFTALCENSCPLHMNIPGYLQLIKENRLEDAFELTLRDNPLPGTLGRICHFHCQMQCRREQLDEPVAQGEIHRYLADTMYKMGKEDLILKKLQSEKLASTGMKIAIVGAGPAGLTAAFYLVRLGHDVTLYEANAKGGGILYYGIPSYRLPKDVIEKEISMIEKLGVKIKYNTQIGKDISFKKLESDNDILILSTGAQKDQELNIPGKELSGVMPGYHFLEDHSKGKNPVIGKKTAILGAGNVAIDAARTVLRLGSEATIVYRRDESSMPANETEISEAKAEGVKFKFMSGPNKIIGDAKGRVKALEIIKMTAGGFDESGRRKPVASTETELLEFDTVILAVGEKADAFFAGELKIDTNKNGTVKTDKHSFVTANPKIYSIGDVVTGPATAAEAMGIAKKAAEHIDYQLTHEKRFSKLAGSFTYSNEVPLKPEGADMNRSSHVPVGERVSNFQEILKGYSGEQAKAEASRCMRCDVKESIKL